jgi:hypothetical protein
MKSEEKKIHRHPREEALRKRERKKKNSIQASNIQLS